MAALKEAALSAAIAWSPLGGPYLAAGTAAGGIDASFSSASAVEVRLMGVGGAAGTGIPRSPLRPQTDCRGLWGG